MAEEKSEDCVFCKISSGEIPKERIYENDNFFSIYDIKPRSEGHSLIIPKKHFANILEMPSTLCTEMMDCAKKTAVIVMEKFGAGGFNCLVNTFEAADQVVGHFHMHIIPRRKGDNLKLNDN